MKDKVIFISTSDRCNFSYLPHVILQLLSVDIDVL